MERVLQKQAKIIGKKILPSAVREGIHTPGHPLDPTTRAVMEPLMGHDFSQVRIHDDVQAAEAARAVDAQAYTIDNHIFVGADDWSRGASSRQGLIAHELAHTLQQRNASFVPTYPAVSDSSSLQIGPSDSSAEAEAERTETQAAAGISISPEPLRVTASTMPGLVQRRTVRRDYATAAFETGPLWDVILTVTGAPDGNSENVEDFVNACMDGIRGAAESLGNGREARSRQMVVRMRYRRGFDYATIEQEAYAAARRSVLPEQSRRAPVQPQAQTPPPAPAPAPPPPTPRTVIVIGSPSPSQAYGYQFVTAALCQPRDANTIWLVEHSGYEMIYGTNPSFITGQAPAGGYGWITPSRGLVEWINSMPDASIGRLIVYSHGVPGLVALRYGWGGVNLPDYGLNLQDVARLVPSKFTPGATIEFNSCNTGVGSGGQASVAQSFANQVGRPVEAWTGRTSYAGINRGTCRVQGSTYSLSTDAIAEWWSRHRAGTAPRFRTFSPQGGASP